VAQAIKFQVLGQSWESKTRLVRLCKKKTKKKHNEKVKEAERKNIAK